MPTSFSHIYIRIRNIFLLWAKMVLLVFPSCLVQNIWLFLLGRKRWASLISIVFSVQDKTELVQLQENLFQARKDASQPNVVAVVTQAEIWGTANERDLSQALNYKYDVLKDRLLRDALMQQVGLTEWEALSENDRFSRLAQMKLKVQALQSEGKPFILFPWAQNVFTGCL